MRIKQTYGFLSLPTEARKKVEVTHFASLDSAQFLLQKYYPNHIVRRSVESLRVTNKDKSFTVAQFEPA